jgi:putative ABC transport system permease protein
MMGTFLNLLGAVRTLLVAIGLVAMTVSILGVFNTLLATVLERTHELSVMRAIGASRGQVVALIAAEALMLTTVGSLAGIVLTIVGGHGLESLAKQWVPLAPIETILSPDLSIVFQSLALGIAAGVAGGLYPAWRAARLHPAEALRVE